MNIYTFQNIAINGAVQSIIKHTNNTWQPDRNINEKTQDTIIGKLAERAFEQYIKDNHSENLIYIPYDNFRKDNHKYHAPFDGLLFGKNNQRNINVFLKQIQKETLDKHGFISNDLKQHLCINQIYITEIKSTRITNRHKTNEQVDYGKIFNDDFLTYPSLIRYDVNNEINNFNDYVLMLSKEHDLEAIKIHERNNMSHLYVRAYVEQKDNNFDVHLISYISNTRFANKMEIKKFPSSKSKHALYLATSLRNGSKLENLSKLNGNIQQTIKRPTYHFGR